VPDERYGETVVAVVSTDGGALSEAELITHVKTRIADYKAPRRAVFVDQVYRSPSGKADYRWARERATS
jgi:acyl-CoA synthetase (AMP-forming)/AMP-acid ligase II